MVEKGNTISGKKLEAADGKNRKVIFQTGISGTNYLKANGDDMGIFNKQLLKGRIALVTGAPGELEGLLHLPWGMPGADVAVTDLLVEGEDYRRDRVEDYGFLTAHFSGTDGVKTRETAEQIKAAGSRSIAFKMDISNRDEVFSVISRIEKELGQIDILINNAGLMDNFSKFEDQEPKRWEKSLQVNITGAFTCSQVVWPSMVKNHWGRIVNISSVAAFMGAWLQPSYGATKAGLIGFTKSLAIEGGRHGITINAVCPGFIETEAVKLSESNTLERIKKRSALGRLGTPDEVAQTVVFISSPAASYITGATIPVTGGIDLLAF